MASFSTGDRMRKPKGDRLDQFSFEMFYKTLSLEFFFFLGVHTENDSFWYGVRK